LELPDTGNHSHTFPSMEEQIQAACSDLVRAFSDADYSRLELLAQSMTERFPNHPFGWRALGLAKKQRGLITEALKAMNVALEIDPNDAESLCNLGVIYKQLGDLDLAVEKYQNAIEIKPNFAVAHSNLANMLRELGKLNDAEESAQKALLIEPENADALNILGMIFHAQGKYIEAESCYKKCIVLKPDYSHAYNNFGNLQAYLKNTQEATLLYKKALEYDPNNFLALNNLGNICMNIGNYAKAEYYFHMAIAANKNYSEAYNNLANCYKEIGEINKSIELYKKAIEIDPENFPLYSNLFLTLNYAHDNYDGLKMQYLKKYSEIAQAKNPIKYQHTHRSNKDANRVIKIGFVSGDLNEHPVGYFFEAVVSGFNKSKFELYAYPSNDKNDDLTKRIKPFFSKWTTIQNLNNRDAADLIHADGIDILFDLSGHTAGNRLPLFSFKPAPVQISWIGYCATTGIREVDYILADETGVPEKSREFFTEKILYLPDTRLLFSSPKGVDVKVGSLPANSNGYITFGCFQTLSKISRKNFLVWREVLGKLPSAIIRWHCVQFRDKAITANLILIFNQMGLDSSRIQLLPPLCRSEYFSLYNEIDIVLDSFPFPGGTTTCEALWMGVPTITLSGETLISRQGASIMTAVGLANWVAYSQEEYIQKVVEFSKTDSAILELTKLRSELRARFERSPLCDARLFSKSLENILQAIAGIL